MWKAVLGFAASGFFAFLLQIDVGSWQWIWDQGGWVALTVCLSFALLHVWRALLEQQRITRRQEREFREYLKQMAKDDSQE